MTRRTGKRILMVVAATLVALVLAGWLVVRSVWFRDWLRDQVTTRVNDSINGTLAIDSITGSLFTDVTLHGVSLSESGERVLSIETVEASYSPLELVSGPIRIDNVTVTRPVVELISDERGWNVTRIADSDPAPEEPESPLGIVIREVVVRDGAVEVIIDRERRASLSDLGLDASLVVDATGTVFDVERLGMLDNLSQNPVDLRGARLTIDEEGLSAENVRLLVPAAELVGRVAVPEAGDIDLDVSLGLDGFETGSWAIYLPPDFENLPPLSGDISLDGPLSSVHAAWDLTMADAATSGELVADVVADAPTVDGRVALRNINPAVFTGDAALDGTVTADIDIDARLNTDAPMSSRGSFVVAAGPIEIGGYRAERVLADGTLADGAVQLTGEVAAYGARTRAEIVVADLMADHADRVVTASGRVDDFDLSALPAATGRPDVPTALSGTYTARLAGPSWDVTFDADESTIGDASLAAGSTVRAASRDGGLEASLSADVAGLSAAMLTGPAERATTLAGHIEAEVAIPDLEPAERLESARGRVSVVLADSVVLGNDVASAVLNASLDQGLLTIEQLDVDSAAALIDAAGTVAVAENAAQSSDLNYTIDVPDLGALPADLITGLRGGARVEGSVAGTPASPTTTGSIHLREPGYEDTASALALNGTFDVAVPDLDMERLAADLEIEATFVTVGDQEVQQFQLDAQYEGQRVDLTARIDQEARSIEIGGGLAIFPEYRQIELRQLTLSGLGEPWTLEPDADQATAIRYGTGDVQIEPMAFVRGPERIEIAGTVGLPDGPLASDLRVNLQSVNVGDALMVATGSPVVTGTANGTVQLTGAFPEPEADVSLTVTDGTVGEFPFTIARADVQLAERVAAVTARVEEPTGAALDIEGTVPVGGDEAAPLDVRATSDTISLGLLGSFTTHLEAIEGAAAIDVRAGGTLADPSLAGTVQLFNGAFTLVPTGIHYQDVTIDVRFEGNEVFINRASLSDEDGRVLTLNGRGAFLGDADARSIVVDVAGEDFSVLDNELGDVEVTVDAHVEGRLSSPSLTGRVVIDGGRLEVDRLLPMLGAGAPAPVVPAPASATPPGAAASVEMASPEPGAQEESADQSAPVGAGPVADGTINLEVELPDNFVLRGQNIRTSAGSLGLGDMNMTVGGTVTVRKGPDEPVQLVGVVEVIRGFYEFQGRRFEVEEGSAIRFRGGDSVNPELDVTASRDVSGIIAHVEVTGTADRPRITLSSDPPLDEGDVLALIIFNQPMSQLGQSEQVDLMDRAGDMALGALATSLANSIGRALDVDLFEIRAPSADGSGDVTLGTQLSDRLFVGFRQEFGSSGASRLSFEYRLTEFLRLLTSVAQGGQDTRSTRQSESAGADLVFRFRY